MQYTFGMPEQRLSRSSCRRIALHGSRISWCTSIMFWSTAAAHFITAQAASATGCQTSQPRMHLCCFELATAGIGWHLCYGILATAASLRCIRYACGISPSLVHLLHHEGCSRRLSLVSREVLIAIASLYSILAWAACTIIYRSLPQITDH